MSSEKPRILLLQSVAELFYWSDSVDTSKTECPKINDKYDEMFLKCAIEGNAEYLISDDFKSGMHDIDINQIKIVGSKDFVSIYEGLLV
jgi:predicted nucleic acid-binding protein